MPETGGNLVFDNRFEAEEHKVTHPDTGSFGFPCAGIVRLRRITCWADRDKIIVHAQIMLPECKGRRADAYVSSFALALEHTDIILQSCRVR